MYSSKFSELFSYISVLGTFVLYCGYSLQFSFVKHFGVLPRYSRKARDIASILTISGGSVLRVLPILTVLQSIPLLTHCECWRYIPRQIVSIVHYQHAVCSYKYCSTVQYRLG